MQYRRTFVPGGTYFFTVVTARRRKLFCDEGTIQLVRQAFHHVNTNRPFMVNAMVAGWVGLAEGVTRQCPCHPTSQACVCSTNVADPRI